MMAIEPAVQRSARGGWAVALDDADESAALALALLAAGVDAGPVAAGASVPNACAGRFGAVIEVKGRTQASGLALLRSLCAERPEVEVVVVHDPSDLATAWAAMRSGATIWHRRPAGRSFARAAKALAEHMQHLTRPPIDPRGVRRAVETAVADAVAGRTEAAINTLCRIHRARGTTVAVEALMAGAVEVLRQLDNRSQYPIPLTYVIDRLDVGADGDLERCIGFLCAAVLRMESDPLPPAIMGVSNATADDLFAGFHAMTALVRFAAARWWTHSTSVLDRVHDRLVVDACNS